MPLRRTVIAIICGSREFTNYDLLKSSLCEIFSKYDEEIEIVSGGARGADALGERFSREILEREPVVFYADWSGFGKVAGPIRNSQMAGYASRSELRGETPLCIAFYPDYRDSDGTADMIKKARMQDIPVRIIRYSKEEERGAISSF